MKNPFKKKIKEVEQVEQTEEEVYQEALETANGIGGFETDAIKELMLLQQLENALEDSESEEIQEEVIT